MNFKFILAYILIGLSTIASFIYTSPVKGLADTYVMIFIHPPFAWSAYICFLLSAWWGYKFISSRDYLYASKSFVINCVGYVFIIFAAFSGMAWGQMVWGDIGIANMDPKFVSIVFVLILYSAYFVLRNSVLERFQKARISCLYSLISSPFATFFIFIMPRIKFSLHPSNPILAVKEVVKDGNTSSQMAFGLNNILVLSLSLFSVLYLTYLIYQLRLELELKTEQLETDHD